LPGAEESLGPSLVGLHGDPTGPGPLRYPPRRAARMSGLIAPEISCYRNVASSIRKLSPNRERWAKRWRSCRTNQDGRCDAPLLSGVLPRGLHEIVFAVGAWREGEGFYDEVPVRFSISDPEGPYQVPLILAPFGYSTYRGS
jgi:5-hydroxyisourate hydrolase